MKKILFLLMTTQKYCDRQSNILSTWGKDEDLFFYSEHTDEENRVLKVCEENDVEIKQISIFKEIEKKFHNQYEWFFFGDDDTFVNTKLLKTKLNEFDKTKVIGQNIKGCFGDELNYPSGGGGFLLHHSLIENFYNSKNFKTGWGDVTFGLNMKEKNIEIEHNELILSQHYSFYNINLNSVKNFLTFHYVKSFYDMNSMKKICDEI